MYGTNYGSVSGIIHLIARRPVVAASIAVVALAVASVPTVPPPPPTPPPPAVVSMAAPEPAPTPAYGGSHKHTTYSCEFSGKTPTNLCKATLDAVATFLNNDTAATVVVTGDMARISAVRKYFTQGESKFGIDAKRITLVNEGDGNVVSIEQIP